ncbi:5-formyltetrahydrofolate cyclo-ligase [Halarchaeum rubridurum]|uniref:5-formyltetrahydrofolate cyclo-ligase n=1 Tax=Halarchaeum rubridurum TaxID=489911 RepID=A0A830FSV2_9EURY|nr:5-formyltetrahydrofolate cyclo-ligase [Halarchaeum rubridurum]MBP1953956.1 5-formyltetrahydrofolate cyclo-ligase [Halarchaeum rubridurum]GGM56168.1 5-formyltetrahydrofolate cyclo-ligase [Halarchaeum rubridurum]
MTSKDDVRESVWDALEDEGLARFPFPPHGRIPNVAGADDAAERLAATDAWRDADVVKANPDAPQLPARRRALHDGKTLYMAVPRLRDPECFLELDPERLDPEAYNRAPALSNVDDYAEAVRPAALGHVDLVLSGSVAVSEDGARVGKGEGFSDVEFGVLVDLGLVDDGTTVATTVHERQVFETATWPVADHDVPMELVVTPERVVETDAPYARPSGVDWDAVSAEDRAEIPILAELAAGRDR